MQKIDIFKLDLIPILTYFDRLEERKRFIQHEILFRLFLLYL